MTNEEAIEVMEAYKDRLINSVSNQLDKDIEAFEMAIKALSSQNDTSMEQALLLEVIDKFLPEPYDDTISREAVIEAVSKGCQEWRGIYNRCEELINELPSITQKSGKWKYVLDAGGFYICSECGCGNDYADNFCPHCGAKMVEP